MKLSEINWINNNVKIVRDGEFQSLGLVVSETNKKIMCFVEKEQYLNGLPENVTCLICPETLISKVSSKYGILVCKKPRIEFFKLHNYLCKYSHDYYENNQRKYIGNNCSISEKATIAEMGVNIGNNVVIEDNVVIRENVTIGDNSIIRAGTIIGGNGFEFKRCEDNTILQVDHCGGVVIGENVEIQYNTCIDKALYPWDNTIIDNYSKIDNLVYVAHGVKIGKRCLIAANSTIGGRTLLGDDCWVGLSATIRNGLKIGNGTSINMGAVVTKSLDSGSSVSGNFAIDHKDFIEFIKTIK